MDPKDQSAKEPKSQRTKGGQMKTLPSSLTKVTTIFMVLGIWLHGQSKVRVNTDPKKVEEVKFK